MVTIKNLIKTVNYTGKNENCSVIITFGPGPPGVPGNPSFPGGPEYPGGPTGPGRPSLPGNPEDIKKKNTRHDCFMTKDSIVKIH